MDHFELNDDFLIEVGLGNLAKEFRDPFLKHVYDYLELRVGQRLSEDLSDEQLAEFEAVIDQRVDVIDEWIEKNMPEYMDDIVYKRLEEAFQPTDVTALRAEYAATKWLQLNRPDYRDIVRSVLNELRHEISQNREEILAASGQRRAGSPSSSLSPPKIAGL